MSLVQKSLQAPPFHPEGLEQAETCPPHHGHHRGAHRGQACWELTVCSLLFRGGLCVLQVEYQPGTCFLKHNDHSSIFIGQRSSHFEILTPKASPWTGMLHAYYFLGEKNVCFIHVESLDEQSLKYMLDRCSQKGKNRVCLMRWHIPYSGQ